MMKWLGVFVVVLCSALLTGCSTVSEESTALPSGGEELRVETSDGLSLRFTPAGLLADMDLNGAKVR